MQELEQEKMQEQEYSNVLLVQLSDDRRTVNAFELQELLETCLPNDYIKSCASIEVCRQVGEQDGRLGYIIDNCIYRLALFFPLRP